MFDPIIKRTVKKSFEKANFVCKCLFFYVRESIALNGNLYNIDSSDAHAWSSVNFWSLFGYKIIFHIKFIFNFIIY